MSDRCTEGCGLAQFPKGHPETTEGDKLDMRGHMEVHGFPADCNLRSEAEPQAQARMAWLYAEGYGYHAIADLFDRSHDELRELLVQNFPARFM